MFRPQAERAASDSRLGALLSGRVIWKPGPWPGFPDESEAQFIALLEPAGRGPAERSRSRHAPVSSETATSSCDPPTTSSARCPPPRNVGAPPIFMLRSNPAQDRTGFVGAAITPHPRAPKSRRNPSKIPPAVKRTVLTSPANGAFR